jgi:tRNA(fMet)-specific endonuclease VapC
VGLLIDTGVLILAERHRGRVELARWESEGEAFISVITASELLVGVHRADTPQRRNRRAAFVESLLAQIPILDIDLETARVHADV